MDCSTMAISGNPSILDQPYVQPESIRYGMFETRFIRIEIYISLNVLYPINLLYIHLLYPSDCLALQELVVSLDPSESSESATLVATVWQHRFIMYGHGIDMHRSATGLEGVYPEAGERTYPDSTCLATRKPRNRLLV